MSGFIKKAMTSKLTVSAAIRQDKGPGMRVVTGGLVVVVAGGKE